MHAGAAIVNIDRKGVERRLHLAVVAFAITLGAVVALRLAGAPAFAFGFVFVPFTGAFWLAYQALFQTCTSLAACGQRDVGEGEGGEVIASPTERQHLRARGRRIVSLVFASAAVATALVVAVTAL